MMRSMYSAISGLQAHQTMLDVISNNLANVNTVGYKADRTSFRDDLQQNYQGGTAQGATTGGVNPVQVGLGVTLGSVDNLMGAGALQSTGQPLDAAIQGSGWFRVTTNPPTGTPAAAPTTFDYTRAGNFTTDDQGFLVTQDGNYVVGNNGTADGYIQLPAGSTSPQIAADGTVSYIPSAGGARATANQMSLSQFSNEAGMSRVSENLWAATPASGAPQNGAPGANNSGTISAGTLEMSNVDLATEFTNMIVAQRGFEANSKVITTSDQMLQDLVNLRS
jgi:flagellar hook protein FlgE